MTSLRDQQTLDGAIAPLVIKMCAISPKGADGEPSLLSPDDARTLFHEFGHGLHGMLWMYVPVAVRHLGVQPISSKLPSQLYEQLAGTAAGVAAVRKALPDRRAAARRPGCSASSPRESSTRALPPWSSSLPP